MTRLTRRLLIKMTAAAMTGVPLLVSGCGQPERSVTRATPAPPSGSQAYLSVARGGDPVAITRAAVEALGGMQRFVKPGQQVVIKPNLCVAYHTPEYAATTNPDVVGTLVRLCLEAGAGRVRVMDHPLGGTAEAAYSVSGVGAAVTAAGGEMQVMVPIRYARVDIPNGKDLKAWEVHRDILEADVLINVPIAKHHSLARLSLGCKNMLGAVKDANQIHSNLGQRVADVASLLHPTLTVMDAFRILVANGPTGGSLSDVRQVGTVIASHDVVAADAYAATLFGLSGSDVAYVKAAAQMGLGTLDLKSIRIQEVSG